MLCNCEISTLTLFPRIFIRHTKFLHTSNETFLVLRHRLWFPGWLQFHYLVMDDLQFLILPPLPPKCCAFKDMYRYIQFMLCLDWNLSSILARQALYQMSYYWIPQTYFLKFVDSVLLQVLFYLRNYTCLVHDILTQYFLRSRIPLPVFMLLQPYHHLLLKISWVKLAIFHIPLVLIGLNYAIYPLNCCPVVILKAHLSSGTVRIHQVCWLMSLRDIP